MAEQEEITDAISFRPRHAAIHAEAAALAIQNIQGVLYQVDDQGNLTPLLGGGTGGITALTGDVAASGVGSVAATIQANVVTYAKFQKVVGNNVLLGNIAGANSNVSELTPGNVRALLGLATIATSGSASDLTGGTLAAGLFPAFTGDVTTSAGATATTIAANAVTTTKIQANAVTLAKLATQANDTFLGNISGGAAVPSALTSAQVLTGLGFTGVSAGTYTNATVTVTVAGIITAIANGSGGGSGITQLTGDVTAGPGSGSVAASLKNTGPGAGSATYASITIDAQGRVTALSSGSAPTTYTFSTGLTNASGTVTANLSTGKSGGQTAIGGTGAGESLTVSSTSNATKGDVIFGSTTGMVFNEATDTLSLGISAAAAATQLHLKRTAAGGTGIYVEQASAASTSYGAVALGHTDSISGVIGALVQYGSGYTTSGNIVANALEISQQGSAAPMLFDLYQASGDFIWQTGVSLVEQMRLTNAGVLIVQSIIQSQSGTGDLILRDLAVATAQLNLAAGQITTVGNIVPLSDDTYSLGTTGKVWSALWVDTIARTSVPAVIEMVVSQGLVIDGNSTGSIQITHQSTNGRFASNSTGIAFFQTSVSTPACVAQQASGANLTNNVTSGGTTDTIANYTDLVIYANDSAAIRNDIYQLSRKMKQINDGLRAYGLFT